MGDNGTLVTTLAQNKGNMKVLGVVIANALVALCGGFCAKSSAAIPRSWALGRWFLAWLPSSLEFLSSDFSPGPRSPRACGRSGALRFLATPQGTTAVLLGSILYKFCIQIAINAGLPANMLKFITAALFLLVLVIAGRKGEEIIHA